jgi:hypothetical protein
LQKAIIGAVAAGVSSGKACEIAGIPASTGRDWLSRGSGGRKDRPPEKKYAAFAVGIKKAKAADEKRRVARITKAAKGGEVLSEHTVTYPDGHVVREVTYSRPTGPPTPGSWSARIRRLGAARIASA